MLNLERIATVTGGTLVTAAGKKTQVKPNLQHHKTFGVKKPKGALPGPSAGGWMKKNGKKVIIPDTRNSAALEKLADMLAPFFDRIGNYKWTYAFKSAKAEIVLDGLYVDFDVIGIGAEIRNRVEVSKVTSKQIDAFARYVQELGSVKLPKVPAFLSK